MADPTFSLNKDLFGGEEVVLTAMANTPTDVALALATNQPFPDRPIELGSVALAASSDKVAFSTDVGPVALRAQAGGSVSAGLALSTDPQKLLDTLTPDEQLAPALALQNGASRFVMLQLGYDLNASAKAALPLGSPGSVTFGVDGKTSGLFAVIQRFDKTEGARSVVTGLASNVRLPRQVKKSNDLDPGTWLIVEVNGSIGVQLGAQLGFNFNWVRQVAKGTLSGDIGLRLQLGVQASLGFSASGSYLVALSRPGDSPELRLRLFKLAKKGWNFALNANSSVTPKVTGLPDNFNDFVAAIFGINNQQLLEDLNDLRRWTDPKASLPDLLSGAGVDYAKGLLEELTGINPEQEFDKAKAQVVQALDAWKNLPGRVSALVAPLIQQAAEKQGISDELESLKTFLNILANGSDEEIEALIQKVLAEVSFFQTAAGQWLESIATGGLLSLFDKTDVVKQAAATTLTVLDGSVVEDVLTRLQSFISKRLSLDTLEAAVDQTTFDTLDTWLKAKLSTFLGETIDFAGIDKIRTTIDLLLKKKEIFYKKALAALNQTYTFEGAFTFQSTQTSTALLDVTFDGSPASVALMHEALTGNFNRLLIEKVAGVTLNTATLTHNTQRQQHVELHLPFFDAKIDHINEALAKVNAIDNEGGRVLVYDLTATDAVTHANKRNSALTIGANLPLQLGNQTRVFDPDAFSYAYTFDQAVSNMRTGNLRYQLKPYITSYFPSEFSPSGDDLTKASFDTWLTDLDKTLDELEPALKQSDLFGNTLFSLELNLPGRVAAAWLKAPSDKKDAAYMRLSRRLQRQLKQLIPFYFFQDVDNYDSLLPARVLMVYAAIPSSTSIRLQGSKLTLNTDKSTYWNWPSSKNRQAMALAGQAQLAIDLNQASQRLIDANKGSKAQFYKPQALSKVINAAFSTEGEKFLNSLLFVEAEMIDSALKAGRNLAKFLEKAEKKPADAIEALAAFGSKVTETFNENVTSVYGGSALRPLGTMLFVEAARALDPSLASVQPRALLDLAVFKPGIAFPPANFPNNEPPASDDVVIQQRIVELDTPSS